MVDCQNNMAITLIVTVEVFPIFVITVDQPPPKGTSLRWSRNVVSESSSLISDKKNYIILIWSAVT